ncbi:MAG: hypothetical protein GX604_06925 [Actinobacteria bacterium]|nr:hypothetical protein [Actinomycetota bacterium]
MNPDGNRNDGNGHRDSDAARDAIIAVDEIPSRIPQPTASQGADESAFVNDDLDLTGRTMYIPHMPYGGSVLFAAAFRSIGIDGRVVPHADALTLEIGGRYTSGEECYPQKIVTGDFMKLLEVDKVDHNKVAFLLPTANGPCRFGQYAGLQRHVLDEHGYPDIPIVSLSSVDGYKGIGRHAPELIRTAWRALILSDILMKLLLMTRPYEINAGDADSAYLDGIAACETILEIPGLPHDERLTRLVQVLPRIRDNFRAVHVRDEDRPLIGVVGEIFTRLNSFANQEVIRRLEAAGAECWLAGVAEWIWYTNEEQFRRLREERRRASKTWLRAFLTKQVMERDEKALYRSFAEDFRGYEEPHVPHLLKLSHPYLPAAGCGGEMVLSTGGSIFFYEIGADGIADISPFSCMNAIITEAVYPKVSRDHDRFPMRMFYFDGTQSDLDRDVGIFLELARTYKRRKKIPRRAVGRRAIPEDAPARG